MLMVSVTFCAQGHTGPVVGLTLSRDGITLFSSSHDATLRSWSTSDGAEASCPPGCRAMGAASARRPGLTPAAPRPAGAAQSVFTGHQYAASGCIVCSRDGDTLYSCSNDNSVRSWRSKNGSPLHCFEGHTKAVVSLALSRDGTALYSGSVDGTIRAWRTIDGTLIRALGGHKARALPAPPPPPPPRALAPSSPADAPLTLRCGHPCRRRGPSIPSCSPAAAGRSSPPRTTTPSAAGARSTAPAPPCSGATSTWWSRSSSARTRRRSTAGAPRRLGPWAFLPSAGPPGSPPGVPPRQAPHAALPPSPPAQVRGQHPPDMEG